MIHLHMDMKKNTGVSTHLNSADQAAGVIGYYHNVIKCFCEKYTNLVFRSYHGFPMITCSQSCADENSQSSLWKRNLADAKGGRKG